MEIRSGLAKASGFARTVVMLSVGLALALLHAPGCSNSNSTSDGLDAASCAPLSSCTGICWPATWTEALANLCNHPEVIAVPNCLGYDEIWEAMSNGSSYTIYYDANTGNLIGEEFNHGDPGGGITCYGTLGSSACTPSITSTFSCGRDGG